MLHQSWVLGAGGHFRNSLLASERHDQRCEVSPLVSMDGEALEGVFPPSLALDLPLYVPSSNSPTPEQRQECLISAQDSEDDEDARVPDDPPTDFIVHTFEDLAWVEDGYLKLVPQVGVVRASPVQLRPVGGDEESEGSVQGFGR
mmetsp:Transcript_119009/g.272936  ORF Transcript_119009/g.272936 Transcript_119009/m.272936 type:complete len:145 (-) Transcript_119009:35-469(-)